MATAFELISDTTLTSAAASISATVSTDYRRFRLTLYVVKDGTLGAVQLRLNGDTGANYAHQSIQAASTSATGARTTGQTAIRNQTSQSASAAGLHLFEISKPLATTAARVIYPCSYIAGSGSGSIVLDEVVGEWSNTSDLISSIVLSVSAGNFAAGTRLLVEGAKP